MRRHQLPPAPEPPPIRIEHGPSLWWLVPALVAALAFTIVANVAVIRWVAPPRPRTPSCRCP